MHVPAALARLAGVFAAALLLTLLLARTHAAGLHARRRPGLLHHARAGAGGHLARRANRRSRQSAEAIIRAQPEVQHLFDVGGFSFTGSAPNRGIMFALLKPWGERKSPGWCQLIFLFAHPQHAVAFRLRGRAAAQLRLLFADPASADLRVQSAGDQRRRQFRRLPVRTRGPRQRRPDDVDEHRVRR